MILVLGSESEHSNNPNFYCRCNYCFSHVKHSMVTLQSVILAYGILVQLELKLMCRVVVFPVVMKTR